MSGDNFAVLYGNNAEEVRLEAARLMSEALTNPEKAEVLIGQAMRLFEYANSVQADGPLQKDGSRP